MKFMQKTIPVVIAFIMIKKEEKKNQHSFSHIHNAFKKNNTFIHNSKYFESKNNKKYSI